MSEKTTSRCRYEWCLTVVVDGEEFESLYQGTESTSALGNLFTMWVQDQGELTNWTDAPQFGEIVVKYSDLTPRVIAVWLGLSPDTFSAQPAPEGVSVPVKQALSWQFTSPDGHPMTLERIIRE
ncbi:hypothetical protein [Haloarcula sebkhae]|nr:hypothetical protein [Haloarcula sebkhae]